jgi:hypothetical protein
MKGLLSTAASRAWMGVAAAGVVIVALVLGLQLIPRLGDGQKLVDAAQPALTDGAVTGEVGATKVLSQYIDLADPLMTRKGDSRQELQTLVTMIKRKTGVSAERARALLRREAPHTEALLRAVPFSDIARERHRLTVFLATTLTITPEQLQDELAREFPHVFQLLSDLPSVTSGWRDVPGIDGLRRFDGKTPVTTMPQLGGYLDDDLVATVADQKDRFQSLAGSGGIGWVPWLLLVLGVATIAFGLLHASWSRGHPSGRVAWGAVVAIGVFVLIVVGALQLYPRLHGADEMARSLEPAFESHNVSGLRAGTDLTVQAVALGDPIMTPAGGATAEVPQLVSLISERTGVSERDVRARLRRTAPKTMALLFDAIPLTNVAAEVPHLLAVLRRKLHVSHDALLRSLHRRTPGIAQALVSVGPVTAGWDRIPGSDGLHRFDGSGSVRTMPQFAEYLDEDVVAVFESQGPHLRSLADTWPRLDVIAPVLLAIGLLVAIYGATMLFFATKPPQRA